MSADQAAPGTIDEYVAGFPREVREVLEQIRSTVRRAAPDAEEAIKYGMPTYVLHGNLVYFAAFKKHVGFFGTPTRDAALNAELAPWAGPKGSLKFPMGKPVPLHLIRRVVEARASENLERAEAWGKK